VPLSGPEWVPRFPTSRRVDDLVEPFRAKTRLFLAALRDAGASVVVGDTVRPPERAYLMHFSFAIAKASQDPATVPPKTGVDIQWLHLTAEGQPDPLASKAAAEEMVAGYDIVFQPALSSRHTEGQAIDMTITWQGSLTIANPDGSRTTIATIPRNGTNPGLHEVGKAYGVIKLVTDPPHWSSDGH
jgi:hypothetical protein